MRSVQRERNVISPQNDDVLQANENALQKDQIMQKSMLLGCLAVAALACAANFAQPAAAAGAVVKVSLTETTADMDATMKLGMAMGGDMAKATMFIKATPAAVAAGEVTFQVANDSKSVVHEMIVAAIADAKKPMPYIDNENRVDEDKAGDLGEVSELDPGKSGSLTVTLKPGTYLLYCNVPGHYLAGMWTTITAK
jgi:uncharacterized cupredoxin-like copper-binding protein